MITSFKELTVWQQAMRLTVQVYNLVKLLPREEQFALSDQMRRAAVSIPSNIAEGNARNSKKEYANFLSIARGSAAELETQLLLCMQLNYLQEHQTEEALKLCEDVSKMLTVLIRRLSNP